MSVIRNNHEAIDRIVKRESFRNANGSLSAESTFSPSLGYAPQSVRDTLAEAGREASRTGQRVYVVYSYATPIAYIDADGYLVVFTAKYSQTTGRHTSICHQAAAARRNLLAA